MDHTSMLVDAPVSAHAQVIQMATAYWGSRALFVAARLGLADQISGRPRTAREVAAATGTHAPSLYRLMRVLAGLGVLVEDEQRRFDLTPLGAALRTDAPGAARSTVLALAGDWWWRGWEHLEHCVETGETGMQRAWGTSVFEFLASHPDEAAHFNNAMIGFHGAEPAAVAEAYDFSRFHTVVDVGGGTGNLLAAILRRHPDLRGVLADRPHVVREATAVLGPSGVEDRVTLEAIDFFETVPRAGDVYVLSHVIHDWDEARCLAILQRCRAAMTPSSRLLIIETVLMAGDAFHSGALLDLAMLVMPGGRERTEEEYGALLEAAGFRMVRVVPTASSVSVIEAAPVDARDSPRPLQAFRKPAAKANR